MKTKKTGYNRSDVPIFTNEINQNTNHLIMLILKKLVAIEDGEAVEIMKHCPICRAEYKGKTN